MECQFPDFGAYLFVRSSPKAKIPRLGTRSTQGVRIWQYINLFLSFRMAAKLEGLLEC